MAMHFSASKATSSANTNGSIVRSLVMNQASAQITAFSPMEMPISRVIVNHSEQR